MNGVSYALRVVSAWCAKPVATLIAVMLMLLWALLGPLFHFSDTYQLILNTGTSIVTFVLLFVFLYAQGRDTAIILAHLKAQTVATPGVDNSLVTLEHKDDVDVDRAHSELAVKAESPSP